MSCCCLLEDVLIEVLSRLSVKTLMRFKFVSKSWSALIQNPNFISTQLNRSMCSKDKENLVIVHRDGYTKEDICTMFPNDNQDMSVELRMSPKSQCYILVMGPCNGLFCMYDYFDDFYLCNPATRETKCLPKSIARPPGRVITLGRFGFGFDPKTRDYKVIRLIRCSDENCEYQIALYTLSTNSWRKINAKFPAFIIYEFNDVSMHLNGVYHWWALPLGATKFTENAIVSFDMASECFERTPLPKLSDEHVVGTFTKYNESFAVIFCYNGETNRLFDLWAMDGYGDKVCWTQLLTIRPVEGVGLRSLGIWKNNEFFFMSRDKRPVSYNSNNQIVRILMFDNTEELLWCPSWIKMVKYTESLVSINGKN